MKAFIKNTIYILVKDTKLHRYIKQLRQEKYDKEELARLKAEENIDIHAEPIIEVINLNADDVCNSRCVMCNIWKQTKEYEISPDDLYNILKDPLYANIKHVGVTGGEPTLREDLPLLYEAIFKALPNIHGVSTITNCIKQDEVIARIEEVIEMSKKYNKPFSMMVSLDGVGDVHDSVRRRRGNFVSAMYVLNHFRNKGIIVSTGTTISKVNVWEVDDMLVFLRENNIYGRFRIAEFIKRLYNDANTDVIRNFDADEIHHLILFFYKLIYTFEKDATYIRTYKSIINVLSGGKRLISCPYKKSGIVLNSKGEIAYCAPKSATLGNALNESSITLYKDNLAEKRRIFDHDCDNCIHDYHAPITYKEKVIELNEKKWRKIISLNSNFKAADVNSIAAIKNTENQIFITGWYGTETVGDKAILGQIIDELYREYGESSTIVVSSIYPIITERTLKELKLPQVKVVPVYDEAFIAYAKGSDISVMGGGPLMDLDELALPLAAFKLAKHNNKKCIVYGCGLGPLTSETNISAVKEILALADVIKLRDKKSVELAQKWLGNKADIEMTGDPAKKYLQRYILAPTTETKKKTITCFLREWTYEYAQNQSCDEFLALKKDFERGLANFIMKKAKEVGAEEIRFEHMHNFIIGNDDRDFARHLIKEYFADSEIPVTYNKKLSTVDSVVEAMKSSTHNICMRFHSVVFAHTLETEFTAIDYTQGGKIFNYLIDNNCPEKILSVNDLSKT